VSDIIERPPPDLKSGPFALRAEMVQEASWPLPNPPPAESPPVPFPVMKAKGATP
jgi:hypothetical protein